MLTKKPEISGEMPSGGGVLYPGGAESADVAVSWFNRTIHDDNIWAFPLRPVDVGNWESPRR
ncbi:MAG: hypothetical protein ACI35N_02445 [Marinilabiliaceae bacterium]